MKSWNQLFIRHGWLVKESECGGFDYSAEIEINLDFLFQTLNKAEIEFTYTDDILTIKDDPMSEEKWIEMIDDEHRGIGGGLWFRPGVDQPKVPELDTFICGIVRQLNRLGFHTIGSCDGHGRRVPYVMVKKNRDITNLIEIIELLGFKGTTYRENRESHKISFHLSRLELLDLAEKLHLVKEDWLEKETTFIKRQLFNQLLLELLNIPGVSGEEEMVREFVLDKIMPLVDHVTIDRAGNILAEKTYRGGNGPVILLNAHLDTVYEFAANREIVKEGNLWSSSKGILGADDRAGVAVLLQTANYLQHSSFTGKVKFIFTVEEECGLMGAQQVDDYFLWGTDAAIVVDRRGHGDIVTSCGGYIPFCDERYGAFFERVAAEENLAGWKTTVGGSSDTRIWAGHGIQSVNLSVGYLNEHRDNEFLNVEHCYETVRLLEGVFNKSRDLRAVLRSI